MPVAQYHSDALAFAFLIKAEKYLLFWKYILQKCVKSLKPSRLFLSLESCMFLIGQKNAVKENRLLQEENKT